MNRSIILAFGILIVALASIYFFTKNNQRVNPSSGQQTIQQESTQTAKISTDCDATPTPAQTEGPYYKANSPEKTSIAADVNKGVSLVVTGFVFDKNCKPIPNAWLDFWQANTDGEYDLVGNKLRGHQFTNESGQYRLETIIPAAYENRPPHIHVKVRPPNGQTLTSQLYFPNEALNQRDSIFNEKLIMDIGGQNSTSATFNFVLP